MKLTYGDLDRILRRSRRYRQCFQDGSGALTEAGNTVLADLARFCRYNSTSLQVSGGRVDPYATAAAEGRREVFLWIVQQLKIDPNAVDRAVRQSAIEGESYD